MPFSQGRRGNLLGDLLTVGEKVDLVQHLTASGTSYLDLSSGKTSEDGCDVESLQQKGTFY